MSTTSLDKNDFKGEDLVGVPELTSGAGFLVKPARVFTAAEEKALYRKLDIRIMPILAVLYLLSFMDRGNIGNARLFGLETDLRMVGSDYNIALTSYFITYCLFEVPANLMLKVLRPSIWLSFITVVWGVVMTLMGVVNSYGGLVACRLALGISEAGLFPGVVVYLTFWYPRHYVQLRIAYFFAAATMAGAFSGLLAYGIGFMGGVANYNAWRWIFILEGIVTVIAGVIAVFAIADLPADAKFLNEEERAWVLWKKQSDNSTVGEAEKISRHYIWTAFSDWQVWLGVGFFLSCTTSTYSIGLFLPTSTFSSKSKTGVNLTHPSCLPLAVIKSFGTYTTPQIQLLTVPIYFVACAWVIAAAYLSDRYKQRYIFLIASQVMACLGFVINITPAPAGFKYFGLFLCASGKLDRFSKGPRSIKLISIFDSVHQVPVRTTSLAPVLPPCAHQIRSPDGSVPAAVAWLGNNLSGQTKRGVGMAAMIGLGNVGGIVSSNVYRSVDAPRYFLGHATVIGILFFGMTCSTTYYFGLKRANSRKVAYLAHQDSLPVDQKTIHTPHELRELGDRAPDFAYTL